MLLEYVADRDVACPSCTYNLRGLTTSRCPECGRELKLSVGLAQTYLRAWVLLLFAVFCGAGAGLLLGVNFLMVPWSRLAPRQEAVVIYFMAYLPLAMIVMIGCPRFLRWPRRRQWIVAVLASGTILGAYTLFWFSFR